MHSDAVIVDQQLRPRGRVAAAIVLTTFTLGCAIVAAVLGALDDRFASAVPALASVVFGAVGFLVVTRQPGNRIGWLLCIAGLLIAAFAAAEQYAYYCVGHASASLPGLGVAQGLSNVLAIPTVGVLVAVMPQLFPTGKALSPRWRPPIWAAVGYILLGTVGNLFATEQVEGLDHVQNPWAVTEARAAFDVLDAIAGVLLLVAVAGGVAGFIVRWRRSRGDERQQLKWFIAGVAPVLALALLHGAVPAIPDGLLGLALPIVPITIGVAILRYRLYDLDIVLNRVLVYAALSALTAAVYVAVVVLAEVVVGWGHGLGVQIVATVIAAALFQPLRARIQQGVDRVFFGDRARPYQVLARLGRQLEQALLPEDVLAGVVGTVVDALRVPYAGIELADTTPAVIVAQRGTRSGASARFPMIYQGSTIGDLCVSRRASAEDFGAADRRLLADLARQAGIALHSVQVTTELQHARAALVTAREEERRRLRRDLHDGLGPALAGISLALHAAQTTLCRNAEEAHHMLGDIEGQVQDTVHDIRRLVYGLRPPALDEFGLYRALQQYAARIDTPTDGLAITLDESGTALGELPAAVEVAAFRIVTESLNNVSRHSAASHCTVRLVRNGALVIEVADDGQGLGESRSGVGLTAMRERATELGGELKIQSSTAGTRIWARLPIPEPL